MKKNIFNLIIFILFISILIISCNQDKKNIENDKIQQKVIEQEIKSPLSLKYAKGFDIKYFEDYKILSVYNPFQKKENKTYQYILGSNKNLIPQDLKNFPFIKTPIKRIVCLSTTHIALLDFINETHSLIGISGANYVSNKKVKNAISKNKIKEIGFDSNLNYELILQMEPDIVLAFGVANENIAHLNKLKELNIQVIMNCEYLENHPLGKMEWVKFLSAFYNKEKLAENKFNEISEEYEKLRNLTSNIKDKPKIMNNILWKDIWYVSGGNSYLAQLIKDAGGDYIWKNNTDNQSFPLNLEKVLEDAQDSDIWINIGNMNRYEEVIAIDERLKNFKAFREDNLYNNNLRTNKNGGNDYWENGLIKPHFILKDLIKIFHPELLPKHKLFFYKKI